MEGHSDDCSANHRSSGIAPFAHIANRIVEITLNCTLTANRRDPFWSQRTIAGGTAHHPSSHNGINEREWMHHFDILTKENSQNAVFEDCLYRVEATMPSPAPQLPSLAHETFLTILSYSSSCRTKSCVPIGHCQWASASTKASVTHEDHAAHHVQAGADGGEEDDLVGGDHPLAARLCAAIVRRITN